MEQIHDVNLAKWKEKVFVLPAKVTAACQAPSLLLIGRLLLWLVVAN